MGYNRSNLRWGVILRHRMPGVQSESDPDCPVTEVLIFSKEDGFVLEVRSSYLIVRRVRLVPAYSRGLHHLYLRRVYDKLDAAIDAAEHISRSGDALQALILDSAGESEGFLPERFVVIEPVYSYQATLLDAAEFITGAELSSETYREVTFDWGESIRQLPRDQWADHREFILTFITSAPFQYGWWSHWKWLFKQLDEEFDPEFAANLLFRVDHEGASPEKVNGWKVKVSVPEGHWLSRRRGPSKETINYLKRRGRRYMRKLVCVAPDLYMDVSERLLNLNTLGDWTENGKADIGQPLIDISALAKSLQGIYSISASRSHAKLFLLRIRNYNELYDDFLEAQKGQISSRYQNNLIEPKGGSYFGYDFKYANEYTSTRLEEEAEKGKFDCYGGAGTYRHIKERIAQNRVELEKLVPAFENLYKTYLQTDVFGCQPERHWILADILYGEGARWVNRVHGRGSCVPCDAQLSVPVREERLPRQWSKRLDYLERLLKEENTPWQIAEFSAKVLTANNNKFPVLSKNTINKFFLSSSPILAMIGVSQQLAGDGVLASLPAEAVCNAFISAKKPLRIHLKAVLIAAQEPKNWQIKLCHWFMKHAKLEEPSDKKSYPSEQVKKEVAQLLIEGFHDVIQASDLLVVIRYLINYPTRKNLSRIHGVLHHLNFTGIVDLLCDLELVGLSIRDLLVKEAAETVNKGDLTVDPFIKLLASDDADVRSLCWKFIPLFKEKEVLTREIWNRVQDTGAGQVSLDTFINQEQALMVLVSTGNVGLLYGDGKHSSGRVIGNLIADSVIFLLQHAALVESVELTKYLSKEQWLKVASKSVRISSESLKKGVFWGAIWASLGEAKSTSKKAEITRNERFFSRMCQHVPSPEFTALSPLQVRVVKKWVRQYPQRFKKGSDLLFNAATCPEPGIHKLAIKHAVGLGLTAGFALRLLESGLPGCIEGGHKFFNKLSRGHAKETEYALMLCDSPKPGVQGIGLNYIGNRWDTLQVSKLISALSEHRSPQIQTFVVDQLKRNAALAGTCADFDNRVLRVRNRGRQTKENVKARLGGIESSDKGLLHQVHSGTGLDAKRLLVLVEMARGRATKDSDWALAQLVRAQLDGEDIEELIIDGPVGV